MASPISPTCQSRAPTIPVLFSKNRRCPSQRTSAAVRTRPPALARPRKTSTDAAPAAACCRLLIIQTFFLPTDSFHNSAAATSPSLITLCHSATGSKKHRSAPAHQTLKPAVRNPHVFPTRSRPTRTAAAAPSIAALSTRIRRHQHTPHAPVPQPMARARSAASQHLLPH
jgi:hypothetical protein